MLASLYLKKAGKLAAAISLAIVVISGQAMAEKRVALLIGNSAYQHTVQLKNPSNDAKAMAAKLRSLGFETVEGYDLDFLGMRSKAREFASLAQGSDVALFFYAGHGIAVNGTNYIVPVDAQLSDPTAVDFETVPVDMITDQMKYGNGVNLVLLDACRDNPMATQLSAVGATRSMRVGAGLAEMGLDNAGEGLAIAFATSPGAVAEDGQGEHSPFTTALLNNIGAANTDFTEVMSRVTGEVYNSTNQRQRPWLNASLTGSVVLNPVTAVVADTTTVTPTPTQAEPAATALAASLETQKFMFEVAQKSGDSADYQSYLDAFPDGVFAPMARNAIERNSAKETQTAALEKSTATLATRSLQPSGPLLLSVTPALAAMPSSAETENALFLDKQARRVLQARLNAAGFNVGSADGALGRKSRAGISGWQASQGLIPTGYMNQLQLELLTSQTEATYQQHLTAVVARPATSSSSSSSTKKKTTSSNQQLNNALNNFARGLGQGLGARIGQ
ncbi:hypothetical protein ACMU_08955 [Actibacterium mucosum KCTC 23349]|uniref:Caspase family p20 domain-containing protein n=1 Tax=Actibacterium mucosum KCTC 23349 TaxID=1454373 RepID=A0A037ZK18_9RHOB|nr:caspase family protein [Actibacterium mucosum]KAJ55887.1 hypothetical protein ACMU_08955 [Actibacterium mucosum KCTC 23349]